MSIGILAIDFDDTIAETRFPLIVRLKPMAKEVINGLRKEGWFIIINTCRSGVHKDDAVKFLNENGIEFDLINENHPELVNLFEYDCRKICADIYIDDKNIDAIGFDIDWLYIWRKVDRAADIIKQKGMLSLIGK